MNEQALKARLKHIGKEKGKRFNEVWRLLVNSCESTKSF